MEDFHQNELIAILLDHEAREDERDDVAMDLRAYPNLGVSNALVQVISDPNEETVIIDNSAESYAEISLILERFDEAEFSRLIPFAQRIVFHYFAYHRPDLIPSDLREELLEKYPLPDDLDKG